MHRMDGWTLSDPAGITAATTTIVRRSVETRMARVPRGAAFLSDSDDDDDDDDVLLDATLEDEPDRHVTSGFRSSQGAHIPARKCLQCSTSPRATEVNITELAEASGEQKSRWFLDATGGRLVEMPSLAATPGTARPHLSDTPASLWLPDATR
ncbi:uncharacterized protein LOC125946403 [Dermacentor silvarum]|uniref:uncharacterized protein LOC125946403 n=1 Tax=Dermacentor silvarum TaxID=543639 RepID=UPI002101329A|nr:uncharacterized protein LOC125946403 [Dermacentor silvarum]